MQRKERKTEKASFFKVMIGDFEEKVQIPMQFVLDSGRELCRIDVAILNGPRRTGWRVGLKVEDGRMFFRHGWREFIKHHVIQEGYFLVFRYNGKSHFDVEVFDKSACLKKYDSYDLRDSIEIHRSQPSNPMKRKKSSSESSNFEVLVSEDIQEIHPDKRLKAIKAGIEGESSHPNPKHPHFTAVIKRTNLIMPYMCIPKEFRSVANDLPIGYTMTLRDPERRLWMVEIARRFEGYGCYFKSGWTEFAVANGLEIGDVCFFEIIPSMKHLMDVRIERRQTCEE